MTITLLMTGRLLRRGLIGLASLLLAILLFEMVIPPVADSLGGTDGLEALIRTLPPSIQALTRTRPEFIAVSGLAGYLSTGFTHPLYITLTSAALVTFTARGLAGEMERGTIQLALARSVSRPRVYLSRVLGLVIVVTALSVAGMVGLLLGMAIARPAGTLVWWHLLTTISVCWLLFWAIGGLALCGSAAADTTSRAVGWATTGIVIFYVIDYLATIWSLIEPLGFISLFDYYDPADALVNGRIPLDHALVLALAGLAGVAGGYTVFTRRDLPT
ncbi:MAG: ABC transporter permease subunit [Chloroflexia bacterium]|nr:ABC transporter permease subunit [Chloroflexia bacterium]MDQ3513552.1 ABC transporter permease [Chloroflexota bacterium]